MAADNPKLMGAMRGGRLLPILAALLLAIVACGDGPTNPTAASRLESISGNSQPGTVGLPLEERLVVRAVDNSGIPVPDALVTWSVISGGGTVNPAQTRSDQNGIARTTWTLGPEAGMQEARANISGLTSVSFTATAIPVPASCAEDDAIQLAVGAEVVLVGPQASALCIAGSAITSSDYVATVFNSSRFQSAQINFTVRASGTVAAIGPPNPSLTALEPDQMPVPGDRNSEFHAALRQKELEQLAPKIRGGSAAAASRGALPSPAFSIATPVLGELVSLNVQSSSACSNPTNSTGRIAAISQRAIVISDIANPAGGFSDTEYASIAETFDTLIYPVNVENFGAPEDIDGNNRIVLYYTRAVNELTEQGSPSGFVAGFFFARDLFPRNGNSQLDGCPTSNETEVMYLMVPDPQGSINNNVRTKEFVLGRTRSTLAHELEHLINSSRRLFVNAGARFPERAWLDEGLAHSAEELAFYRSSGLSPGMNITRATVQQSQQRLDAYNTFQAENAARLRDFFGNPNTSWAFRTQGPSLSDRGAAWWFLRYAVDRVSGGTSTPQRELWFSLVNSADTGMRNVEAVIQADPVQWIRDWSVSHYTDDAVAGVSERFRAPSWNMRSIFSTVGYPLNPIALSNNVASSRTLLAGGSLHFRFGIAAGGEGRFGVELPAVIPANFNVVVVRTR